MSNSHGRNVVSATLNMKESDDVESSTATLVSTSTSLCQVRRVRLRGFYPICPTYYRPVDAPVLDLRHSQATEATEHSQRPVHQPGGCVRPDQVHKGVDGAGLFKTGGDVVADRIFAIGQRSCTNGSAAV
jgi:hypothetical protein